MTDPLRERLDHLGDAGDPFYDALRSILDLADDRALTHYGWAHTYDIRRVIAEKLGVPDEQA